MFALVGVGGIGKSVIMVQLCRRSADEEEGAIPVLAHHFFRHDDADRRRLQQALFSIANQIADNIPAYYEALATICEQADDVKGWDLNTLFSRLLVEPWPNIKIKHSNAVVVLDALDECTPADRPTLLQLVANRWAAEMPSWLRLRLRL